MSVAGVPLEILLLAAYFFLELFCYVRSGQLYTLMLVEHVWHIILSTADELMSKKGAKKLCGILLSFILIAILFVIVYGGCSIFTSSYPQKSLIFTICVAVFALPIVIGCHWLNMHYISWRDNRPKESYF